jgi:hypothetical protein
MARRMSRDAILAITADRMRRFSGGVSAKPNTYYRITYLDGEDRPFTIFKFSYGSKGQSLSLGRELF